jgi:hypothetical protein
MQRDGILAAMAALAKPLLGENLDKQPHAFKHQVLKGEIILSDQRIERITVDEIQAITTWMESPNDCLNLGNLIAALQDVYSKECPIV